MYLSSCETVLPRILSSYPVGNAHPHYRFPLIKTNTDIVHKKYFIQLKFEVLAQH